MTTAEPHTLEEMISLCGEEFGRLLGTGQTWRASRRDSAFEATGATPNEAAARLYREIVLERIAKPAV
jgi:hypothetical protein